jgi:hypothetical protein
VSSYLLKYIKRSFLDTRQHVTHVREVTTAYEILVGILKGKRHFLVAGVDPRMILKCILIECGECSGLD